MSKQPVIFNVTYTPANLPRNATIDQVEKNMKERAFYNMSGDNNIYKYMTTDGKVCGNERDKYTILQYFEKTTGVFNDKGIISKEELKEMKREAQIGYKNLWHGFISFDEEHSEQIDNIEKCIKVIKDTFSDFFNDSGFKPNNMDLICSLHIDRPKHLHVHFLFYEKEPIIKNQRGAGYKYRAKGKIPKEALNKMLDRLNNLSLETEYKDWREEELAFQKRQAIKHTRDYVYANNRDLAFERLQELAKKLPYIENLKYNDRIVQKEKPLIDAIVAIIACNNDDVGKSYFAFKDKVENRRKELENVKGDKAKEQADKLLKIENDFNSSLGNLVLRKVYYIQSVHKPRKKKYKVNDKELKKQIRIEESKVKRCFKNMLNLIAQSVLHAVSEGEMQYANTKSAFDVEKEMQREREEQLQREQYEEELKEQQKKEFYNSFTK